jgi:hypothetical protein
MKTVTGRFKSTNPNTMEFEKNSLVQMQNVGLIWIEIDFNRYFNEVITKTIGQSVTD